MSLDIVTEQFKKTASYDKIEVFEEIDLEKFDIGSIQT